MKRIDILATTCRWTARTASLVGLGAVLIEFIIYRDYVQYPLYAPTAPERLRFASFALIAIGFLAGWRWELIGGILSDLGACSLSELAAQKTIADWSTLALAAPGVLYIASRVLRDFSSRLSKLQQPAPAALEGEETVPGQTANPWKRRLAAALFAMALVFAASTLASAMLLFGKDVYGKVVDQYGHPVEGVEIEGYILGNPGMGPQTSSEMGYYDKRFAASTNGNGEFELSMSFPILKFRRHRPIFIHLHKDGYDVAARSCVAPNAEDRTSPAERDVYHIWKLRNPEPLYTETTFVDLPADGTPWRSDLTKEREGAASLLISSVDGPLNSGKDVPPSRILTLRMATGGLIETKELYPYEAPADGYQPSVTTALSGTGENGEVTKSYYIFDGKHYGCIVLLLYPQTFGSHDAGFDVPRNRCGVFINLSGSRNLEAQGGAVAR